MPRRPVYRTPEEQAAFDEARRIRRAASQRARRATGTGESDARRQPHQQGRQRVIESTVERSPRRPVQEPVEAAGKTGDVDGEQEQDRLHVDTGQPFAIWQDSGGSDDTGDGLVLPELVGRPAQPASAIAGSNDSNDNRALFVIWRDSDHTGGLLDLSGLESRAVQLELTPARRGITLREDGQDLTGGRLDGESVQPEPTTDGMAGMQSFPIWDDILQRPVLHSDALVPHGSNDRTSRPHGPAEPRSPSRRPVNTASISASPGTRLSNAIGGMSLRTPSRRDRSRSTRRQGYDRSPGSAPQTTAGPAGRMQSSIDRSRSGRSRSESTTSSSATSAGSGREDQSGLPIQRAFIAEDDSSDQADQPHHSTAQPVVRHTRTHVVRYLGEDDSYGRSTASSSEAEVARPQPPAARATPYSQRMLTQSFRLHGCKCSKTALGRSQTALAEGLSLGAFTRRWSEAYNVPDVVAAVAEYNRLPAIAADSISPAIWEALLAGTETGEGSARLALSLERSCLASKGRPVSITRTWDVDAIIIPLLSLGAFRDGINIFYNPRFTKTITADWHTPVTDLAISPRKCKHLRFARFAGPVPADIYIFFPALPVADRRRGATDPMQDRARCYPTHEEQAEWVDQLVLPALQDTYPAHVLQHHPRAFGESSGRSRARQKENVSTSDRNVSETANFLPNNTTGPNSNLGRFWRAVLRRARDRPRFADMRAVMVTYNCKLQHRSTDIAELQRRIDDAIDRSFHRSELDIDSAFVDLAYEDVASSVDRDEQPLVCVRRTTCNIADTHSLGLNRSSQLFNWTGTADASAIRASPGARSALRKGGIAYMQAYNLQKDMFTLPDRSAAPAFSEAAFPMLAFGQSALDEFDATGRSGPGNPAFRRRALKALRATVQRVHGIISDNRSSPTGFGARQEYRISWALFQTITPSSTAQPDLESRAHHWPFFVLRKSEVCDFLYWQLNRWLLVVCTTLAAHRPVPSGGLPATDLIGQSQNSAMLAVAFACLDLALNSGSVDRYNRFSKNCYMAGRPARRGRRLDRQSDLDVDETGASDGQDGGAVQLSSTSSGAELAGSATTGQRSSRFRFGLDFTSSLRSTNLLWLPYDLFLWRTCSWKPEKLLVTAFVTNRFRRQSTIPRKAAFDELDTAFREEVERALEEVEWNLLDRSHPSYKQMRTAVYHVRWTLWELCIWRFTYELLQRLREGPWLPGLTGAQNEEWHPDKLNIDEVLGFYGLHYRLIYYASCSKPYLSIPRGTGGQAAKGGFSSFDLDWSTRCQLLFDWDDGFTLRKLWENSSWRVWTRYCFYRLQEAGGSSQARRWKDGIGAAAAKRLFMLPKYDEKLFRPERVSRRDNSTGQSRRISVKVLKWLTAQPVAWRAADFPEECRWQLICRSGATAVPVHIEKVWSQRPNLLSGVRFERLGRVEQVAANIHRRQTQQPPVDPSPIEAVGSDREV